MDSYKYYAFISYNHKDVKVARWLHRSLEGYLLPVHVKNELDMEQRYLRPIFWDKEELNSGVLKEELLSRLKASKYLIVICSPNSAGSRWVNEGVKAFIDMGRLDRIIPLMIGNGKDSLPEYLVSYSDANPEKELLWVNVNEVGYEKALIRIISRMLDISFDSLWNRNLRLRKRKRLKTIGIATTIVLLSVVTSVSAFLLAKDRRTAYEESIVSETREAIEKGNLSKATSLLDKIRSTSRTNKERVSSLGADIDRLKSHGYYPAFAFEGGVADVNEEGDMLVVATEGKVELYSVPSFSNVLSISFPDEEPQFISFTGNGKYVVVASHMNEKVDNGHYYYFNSHERIRILDSTSGEVRHCIETSLSNPENEVRVALDPSGHYLALIDGQKIRYYWPPTGDDEAMERYLSNISEDRLLVFDMHKGAIVYSADLNCEVNVTPFFDVNGSHVTLNLIYGSYIDEEQMLGLVADATGEGALSVTDLEQDIFMALPGGYRWHAYREQSSSYRYVCDTCVTQYPPLPGPDRNSWCWHHANLLNMSTGESRMFIPGRNITRLKANKDASVLLTDSNVWVRNVSSDCSGFKQKRLLNPSISRSGHMTAFESDGACYLFDNDERTIVDSISAPFIFNLIDDGILVTSDSQSSIIDAQIQILDVLKGKIMHEFTAKGFVEDDFEIIHFSISSDASYCAAQSASGKMCIYSTFDGELLYVEPEYARSARSVYDRKYACDFIPGTHLLVVTGKSIQLFDVDFGRYISTIGDAKYEQGTVPTVTKVSPDGKTLLTDKTSICKIYDLTSMKLLKTISHQFLMNDDGPVNVCFDSNCSRVILSSNKGGAVLLDITKGKELAAICYEDGGRDIMTGFFIGDKPFVYVHLDETSDFESHLRPFI